MNRSVSLIISALLKSWILKELEKSGVLWKGITVTEVSAKSKKIGNVARLFRNKFMSM